MQFGGLREPGMSRGLYLAGGRGRGDNGYGNVLVAGEADTYNYL